jgi:phage baseplate assembly protein W
MAILYKGFSSRGFQRNKSFVLFDVEIVKRDILNHIFTRHGERVKMADFGTRIPDMAFEGILDSTIQAITEDITTVCEYDPRVTLRALTVLPLTDNHTIIVLADLIYNELQLSERLDISIQLGS